MPQETNLNVAPYFDDFDATKNYNKVLFKPAFPIQARELNNIQSILQGQIEAMGDNLFKEGSVVIPGNSSYKSKFQSIQIQSEFLGVPVNLYLSDLIGKKITGRTSGVSARVVTFITNQESVLNNYTIYLNYEDSSDDGNSSETFFDDEILTSETALAFGNSFIAAGEGFANTITSGASSTGTAFIQSPGIFYLRGNFVTVDSQILILDQYLTNSSYRIGFQIEEKIVTADDDKSLYDNASGFNNFTAPGADRLKITATLAKKPVGDFDTQGFVQIAEVFNGKLKNAINNQTKYNALGNELARRTFEESGHYYISELQTKLKESLNNLEGNRGVYTSGQTTQSGNVPSDDLMIVQVSPGRAYVRGYEAEIKSPQFIDIPKPRSTRSVGNTGVSFDFAPTLAVNNVTGSAPVGFNTTNTLSLRDQRVGEDGFTADGEEIGKARIYDFALEQGAYDVANSALNTWDLSLFDIELQEEISLNIDATLEKSTLVEGQESGATGFTKFTTTGAGHTLMSVQGEFRRGEKLSFSGQPTISRILIDHRKYSLADVKSVFANVGVSKTFSADVKQQRSFTFDNAKITADSAGVSTVTSAALSGNTFIGVVTTGNLITYERPGKLDPSMARIVSVGATSFAISGVTTVTGIVDGQLPTANFDANDLRVVTTKLQTTSNSGNIAGNDTLYSVLPHNNIRTVDTLDSVSSFRIRKEVTISTDGDIGSISVDDILTQTWASFDPERYSLQSDDGVTQNLTADKFTFNSDRTTVNIQGLSHSNDGKAILIGEVIQNKITSKIKRKNIVKSIIVDKSIDPASGTDAVGLAGTTLNDGLTYGAFPFGTRVQDEVISLNVPDVYRVHAVYESVDVNQPLPPMMTCSNMTGPNANTNDVVIGETITGNLSQAKAIILEKPGTTQIKFAYLNNKDFRDNEIIIFAKSGVQANVSNLTAGSPNITKNYSFDNGQRKTIYDLSRIVRNSGVATPSKKLLVYYGNLDYDPNDTGDFTTAASYINCDYGNDVQSVNGFRNTDLIDVRPRVSDYSVSEGIASPFEFDGRTFDNGNHSCKHIISSDQNTILKYDYFLGRADRVYLTRDGDIQVNLGAPADIPELPDVLPGSLNIANIFSPPYLFSVKDSKVKFIQHKRYQMTDIAKLDARIKNLEYYTSLNLLEQNTLNTFVSDVNGLNRFKSGIFIDNFSSFTPQDVSIGIRNSIDPKNKVLRPAHYSTAVNLQVGNSSIPGIGVDTDPNTDSRFAALSGQGVRRTGDVISLDYAEVAEITQPYGTRVENVTPFLIDFYEGSIKLNPTTDVWVSTREPEVNEGVGDVIIEGNFESIAQALDIETFDEGDGLRVGVSPVLWDSWETTGINLDLTGSTQNETFAAAAARTGRSTADLGLSGRDANLSTLNSTTIEGSVTIEQNRTGTMQVINEVLTEAASLGSRVISRAIANKMRERNIEFTATRMKPNTTVFAFFDNSPVTLRCTPKLVQITMNTGTFTVGETIQGTPVGQSDVTFTARVAQANHKYGAYNNPTDFYDSNPYLRSTNVASTYGTESSILNIDTASLASEENPEFSGNVETGMVLRGQSSGAEAIVQGINLQTDRVGTLIGSFNVPGPEEEDFAEFNTGRNVFKLTSSSINNLIEGTTTTSAEEVFYSQGDIDTTEEVTLSLRNARVLTNDTFSEQQQLESDVNFDIINSRTLRPTPPPPPPPRRVRRFDPLAQTFKIDSKKGIYVTKVDLFFQSKDDQLPVTIDIRETTLGTPNQKILAFSEVTLDPDDINVSTDGTAVTTFRFESPVFLAAGRDYALVVRADTTTYNLWISRLGEADVTTLSTEQGRVLVTEQPLLGSLFKSQNSTVWTPSQYEDMKFVLYRADFVGSGNVQFYNPNLDKKNERIRSGGVQALSRTASVGIGTTVNQINVTYPLVPGNRVTQQNTSATGILEQFTGIATGDLTITNPGIGFTPQSGELTFTGVALTALTGRGTDVTADLHIKDGIAIGATINDGGTNVVLGDVFAPLAFGLDELGDGMKLTVGIITANNRLIISNVQGEFSNNANDFLEYDSTGGTRVALNAGVGGEVIPTDTTILEDGLHLKIFQRNHGMYSSTNRVKLSGLKSVKEPTLLLTEYPKSSTGAISIANTTGFDTFENVGVSNTNPGYVQIGTEIISYDGITSGSGTSGTLTGIARAVEGNAATYGVNEIVRKYEFANVSLRRINTVHDLSLVTKDDPIGIDHYHIKLDMSQNGNGTNRTSSGEFRPVENFVLESASARGARGTYNIPYSLIVPSVTSTSPEGSFILASARTISETSVSGREVSYVDQGFEDIQFNKKNYFASQRMVASEVNQENYLSTLPGGKSFTLNLDLLTYDKRISPMIDMNHSSVIFVSNRVDGPITNFATDPRVVGIPNDPNSMIYVTKNIRLENPATSLKVFIDGYVSTSSDVRIFYALDQDVSAAETKFIPFPGSNNIDGFGNIINPNNSDGTPDVPKEKNDNLTQTPAVNDFTEYKFTMDNLPPFKSFRLKLIGTSTNQAVVPQFKNLRAIALA
tara:strand:- start:10921 stop:18507 length:7587 start_codon:yes stop_codon:yes gene_type:complete